MAFAVSSRVCVDGIFCWTDSEVALCWVKGKEKCSKTWVENRVVAITKVVNRYRSGHIQGAVNPADIPTRVCDVKDFDHWFRVPAILFQIQFKSEGFNTTKRLELVEDVVNIEAKGKSSSKGKGQFEFDQVCNNTGQVVTATLIEHFYIYITFTFTFTYLHFQM